MTQQPNNRYVAVPQSGKGAGVLVLHAWWGLNDFFRGFCDRLREKGLWSWHRICFPERLPERLNKPNNLLPS